MKRLIACLIVVGLAVSFSSRGEGDAPPYRVRFGILEIDSSGKARRLKEETSIIPLKLRETGFRFGLEIVPPDTKPFKFQLITYPPSAPKIITGSFQKTDSKVAPAAITSPVYEANGGGKSPLVPLWFDAGDPIGNWKIKISVEGRLTATVEFAVVSDEPKSSCGACPQWVFYTLDAQRRPQ